MERQLAVHARAHRTALIALIAAAVIAMTPTRAIAAPKSSEAKAAFDRGVKAYTTADYTAAREALAASFALEADPETLFAWAQTERQLGRCDQAIELYDKLLAFDLPAENKAAAQAKLDECKAIVAARVGDPAASVGDPAASEAAPAPAPIDQEQAKAPAQLDAPAPAPGGRAWWKDPIGGALVGLGVVGLGVGGVFLLSARNADQDKAGAATYGEYQILEDRADSRGKLGVVGAVTGGVLLGAGIIWYATRGGDERQTRITGWVSPDAGGLVAAGRF